MSGTFSNSLVQFSGRGVRNRKGPGSLFETVVLPGSRKGGAEFLSAPFTVTAASQNSTADLSCRSCLRSDGRTANGGGSDRGLARDIPPLPVPPLTLFFPSIPQMKRRESWRCVTISANRFPIRRFGIRTMPGDWHRCSSFSAKLRWTLFAGGQDRRAVWRARPYSSSEFRLRDS